LVPVVGEENKHYETPFPTLFNRVSTSDEMIIHPDPVLSLRCVQPTWKMFSGNMKTSENGQSVKT